jgi:hypothetical protein
MRTETTASGAVGLGRGGRLTRKRSQNLAHKDRVSRGQPVLQAGACSGLRADTLEVT